MFEVKDSEVVWADRGEVGGFGDSLLDVSGGKRGERSVKGVMV